MAIATESAEHAQDLSDSLGREGEPWHILPGGGYLRSVVYGFNDGLTANFGLVAGSSALTSRPTSSAWPAPLPTRSMDRAYFAAKSEAEVQASNRNGTP
jgi:hypothetical protein